MRYMFNGKWYRVEILHDDYCYNNPIREEKKFPRVI